MRSAAYSYDMENNRYGYDNRQNHNGVVQPLLTGKFHHMQFILRVNDESKKVNEFDNEIFHIIWSEDLQHFFLFFFPLNCICCW